MISKAASNAVVLVSRATLAVLIFDGFLCGILSVFFLLLVGSFWKEEEGVFLKAGWKQLFMWIMFIGIVLIFLQAIKTDNGDSWLEAGWEYIFSGNNAAVVGSIIMVIVLIVLLYFTVREPQRKTNDSHKHES